MKVLSTVLSVTIFVTSALPAHAQSSRVQNISEATAEQRLSLIKSKIAKIEQAEASVRALQAELTHAEGRETNAIIMGAVGFTLLAATIGMFTARSRLDKKFATIAKINGLSYRKTNHALDAIEFVGLLTSGFSGTVLLGATPGTIKLSRDQAAVLKVNLARLQAELRELRSDLVTLAE